MVMDPGSSSTHKDIFQVRDRHIRVEARGTKGLQLYHLENEKELNTAAGYSFPRAVCLGRTILPSVSRPEGIE